MGKSRRKLFLSSIVSGIALILGIPGLADLISLAWETIKGPLGQATPPEFASILSLVSLAVFFVIMYLNGDIFLKGARKGRNGLAIVVAGFFFGAGIGLVLLAVWMELLA
jgi:RsiW-degrading membrane proteinase PrsW (M82 family)